MIKTALVLAAGYGSRMQPITDRIPKPMVEINGQSIITRTIDQLIDYGIDHIIINVFYKKELLIKHIKDYQDKHPNCPRITILEENELLETGGSILNAISLDLVGEDPFFVVNSDAIFSGPNTFHILDSAWKNHMRALFLLVPTKRAHGYDGKGDFRLDEHNQLTTSKPMQYAYIGVRITKKENFKDFTTSPIKVFDIYNTYKEKNTYKGFFGEIYDGEWFHVGTPDAIKKTENILKTL